MTDQPAITTPPVPALFSAEYFAQEIALQSAIAEQLLARLTAMAEYQNLIKQQAVVAVLKQQQALLLKPSEPPTP